ncbi:DUF790 family protein [Pyrinomonas methylaliphatogenes]|uniref:DUF790 family protein n=1 Tax=Pyrinomonas methylaliphatogenes TaxID=454194 RepID=A0A0B6X0F5_9BACT|nr:DUF790 family protein [Pyrinomonas methylaliphatogenes]MBX5478152.1 DUF790 family protein [Pyrinomonas methylaliphatogenes]CDM66467.1 hypothetical protein PYK22_02497 [Pyrinomonas methylaliphatogenes]
MLTADLALSWRRGDKVIPWYIKPDDPERIAEASHLIAIFRAHEGRTREELERAAEEYVGAGPHYRILRGLVKLLLDRCRFETSAPCEPTQLRQMIFLRARQPALDEESREAIIGEVARAIGRSAQELSEGLYADLEGRQRLVAFDEPTPRELWDRYNLAQAQALLYRCVRMRLTLEAQDPSVYRELFRTIKAYRLIHRLSGDAERGYEIVLDGPVSLFHRSQKYGVQMAAFLPALLLHKGWRMSAEIELKEGGRAFYELDGARHRLRSHYVPEMSFGDELKERLVADWAKVERDWFLEPTAELIHVGEAIFAPDFILKHGSGRRVYLEVLGFWTPRALLSRLEEYARCGFKDFLVALSEELRGSRDQPALPPNVVSFKTAIDPRRIEEAAALIVGL